MGNPHAITFVDDYNFDYCSMGKIVENHLATFPNRTNVEFIRKLSDKAIEMKVWERGCGETFACGTGACASVVAAVKKNIISKADNVKVKLIGGDLAISWKGDNHPVYMTGPAVTVAKGEYYTG